MHHDTWHGGDLRDQHGHVDISFHAASTKQLCCGVLKSHMQVQRIQDGYSLFNQLDGLDGHVSGCLTAHDLQRYLTEKKGLGADTVSSLVQSVFADAQVRLHMCVLNGVRRVNAAFMPARSPSLGLHAHVDAM